MYKKELSVAIKVPHNAELLKAEFTTFANVYAQGVLIQNVRRHLEGLAAQEGLEPKGKLPRKQDGVDQ